jgi:hypothetical protein
LNVISATGQKVAAYEGFKDYPNIRGAAKITGDVVALMSMGFILHGPSRRGEFSKGAEEITKEADVIANREYEVNQSTDSIVKNVQLKAIEIDKQRLESKAAKFAEEFGNDLLVTEEAGRQAERVAQEKVRPVVESPEIAKIFKQVEKDNAKVEPVSVETLQGSVDSNEQLAGKIKVDALGVKDTTTPEGYAQITITADGRNGSFNVKADLAEIIKKFNQVESEWKVGEKKG